jgi:hypothetical protein
MSNGVYGAEAMEYLAKLENGISTAPFKYIGLSTDTLEPKSGQIEMPGEVTTGGGERAEATASYEAPGIAVWTHTFTFSADVSIAKIGIFDAPSGGHMLLQGLLSKVKPVESGDDLTIIVKDSNSPVV